MTPFQLLVKDRSLSLKEISEITGIGYSTLGNYNQGSQTPNAKNAQILADYFGVSIPYLLGLDNVFEKPPTKMNTRIPYLVALSGKTLKKVSKETGIAYPTLTSYNQGIRNPKNNNAVILAKYFGVSVPYLLGRDDIPTLVNPRDTIPAKWIQELFSISHKKSELLQEYMELDKREKAILKQRMENSNAT